jgi:hypothetical protein
LERDAGVFNLKLTAQTSQFFFELLNAFLFSRFGGRRSWSRLVQARNALLSELSTPLGKLV